MIDRGAYGSGRQSPNLTPDVTGNADLFIGHIAQVQPEVKTGDGRTALILRFSEFPDHAYWVNVTGVNSLCDQLGENEKDWVGKRIPLVRTKKPNPQTGRQVVKYDIADPEDWKEAFARASRRTGARRAKAATKSKAKGSKKKRRR